jgi:hypothetical protein
VAERAAADDGTAVLALPWTDADTHEALPDALHGCRSGIETGSSRARIIVVEIIGAEDK